MNHGCNRSLTYFIYNVWKLFKNNEYFSLNNNMVEVDIWLKWVGKIALKKFNIPII